ncbi:MAG TPA: hypothetical protein VLA88_06735 [Candidatus Saccharimonadales bacterium]|nr:hypothetical protein [Candidatus Saccharimonadales bacterium]
MFSKLFFRHKLPEPNFGPWLFTILVVVFAFLMQVKPVLGMAGMGTVCIVSSVLVLLNRERIWENYKQTYKSNIALRSFWHEPKREYYAINVYFLWPLVGLAGVALLVIAYQFS